VRDLAEHGGKVGVRIRERGGQEMRQEPQRDVVRPLGGGGATHGASLPGGDGQALVRQTRLPDTRRSVDHEPVGPGVVQGGGELVELAPAPGQGPLQGQNSRRR